MSARSCRRESTRDPARPIQECVRLDSRTGAGREPAPADWPHGPRPTGLDELFRMGVRDGCREDEGTQHACSIRASGAARRRSRKNPHPPEISPAEFPALRVFAASSRRHALGTLPAFGAAVATRPRYLSPACGLAFQHFFDKEPTMVRTTLRLAAASAASAALLLGLPNAALAAGKPVTFSKDVAPIFQAKCQSCHEPGSIAPMSLMTYRGSAAVGAVDQGARRRAADAAVAHRPQRRRPEVQERHVAHRRADRHHRRAGSIRARRRATRPTCRRPSRSRRRSTGRPSATATDRPTSS